MKTLSIARDINLLKREKIQPRDKPVNPLYNAWAEIDLQAVKHNIDVIHSSLSPAAKMLAVVKADAYGHGIKEISRAVMEKGVEWLGVTSITEALELRRLYSKARILIMSAGMYAHSRLIVKHNLTPVVCSRQMLHLLNDAGAAMNRSVRVHIKVDTGMGRLGIWYSGAVDFVMYAAAMPYIEIEGICSHFASAGSRSVDIEFTKEQFRRFNSLTAQIEEKGINIPLRHIANSSALFLMNETHLNLVRAGISVYGLLPSQCFNKGSIPLKPALSLKSRVAFIKSVSAGRTVSYGRSYTAQRDTKIATIPIGYSSGLFRSMPEDGYVLIGGVRAPMAGVVTMDQIMADTGHIPSVSVGDEVVLIGKQGNDTITAAEAAGWAHTIPYEILCKLNVPRVYFE